MLNLQFKAPMLGIAYRRPAPQSPPYVDVGSFVKEDDTVCLIEIMKTFNAVKAGVCGHIAEVLFDESMAAKMADRTVCIGPPRAQESYLKVNTLCSQR